MGSGWPASVKLDQVVSAGKYFKKHSEDTRIELLRKHFQTCTLKDCQLALPELVGFCPVLVQRGDVHQVTVQPRHLQRTQSITGCSIFQVMK